MITIESLQEIAKKEIELAGPRYTPGIDNKAPNIQINTLLEEIDCLVRSKRLMQILDEFLIQFDNFFSSVPEICKLQQPDSYYISNTRISEIKIDPTFPSIDCGSEFLPDKSVLGEKDEMSAADWVNNGRVPNVTSILHKQAINNVNGPWILLDGYLSQENKNCQKQIFSFIRGLLVSKENKDEIVQLLEKHNIDDITIPEVDSDYLVYAGEIPWCENFVEYEQKYLNILAGTAL